MDPLAALPQPVSDALARGWTVVTGNQRAARTLRRAFDLRQRTLGLASWQPPAILAWDSWLSSLWHRLLIGGRVRSLLLNGSQEHTLWRAIIGADPGAATLRPLDSLAELAASAWSRMHDYQAGRRLQAAASTTDTRAFARWATEFERRCLREQYITAAQMPAALADAVEAGQANLPAGILLVGFDSVTPSQEALLDSVRATGVPIEELYPEDGARESEHPTTKFLLADCPDRNSELEVCARWLRNRLRDDPSQQIAVIVPDIDADRASIERIFRNTLAPESNDIAAAAASGPFEFSLGISLDRTPIISTALDILRWTSGPLAFDRLSALLLSPHFAVATSPQDELLARAEFDAFILRNRPLLEPQLSLDDLVFQLARSKYAAQLPSLLTHLRALGAAVRRTDLSRERGYADWAGAMQQILDASGWAPFAMLDSVAFQARRKWEDALDELAMLDFNPDPGRVSFGAALDAVARISQRTLFAPESRHALVQVLGPLEAAGSSFDAIWFLQAGDLTWPPASTPNPLLPYTLQSEFAMPGVDPVLDIAHAQRMTSRIAASAPAIIFSYAQHAANGRQRPSPILAGLNLEPVTVEATAPAELPPVPILLDRLLDDTSIPAPPERTLTGGASILQAQAACPFRAFAERRLFSAALDDVSLGLDARDRGSIIHSVLHDFWTEIRTQAALRAMTTAERDALLMRCIDAALARDHSRPASGWPSAYFEAERERLMRLLRPWLEFEANDRPPFVVKSSEEELKGVPIGPLHLDIRVDRVDETIPGSGSSQEPAEIILDYKTGQADPSGWEGERPDSPQLPLYAVVSEAPHLAAVAFASIRPGKFMALSGYQSQTGILPAAKRGQTMNLEEKREEWRKVLTSLAQEFHSGHAVTLPKDYPDTCRYCSQRLLCRLDLSALAPTSETGPENQNGAASAKPPGDVETQA